METEDIEKLKEAAFAAAEMYWKKAFIAIADAHNAEMKRATGTEGK